MRRSCLLLLAVLGWASLAGCQGDSQPQPLTPEQESAMKAEMQKVQDAERAHFATQAPDTAKGGQ
jgi:hypothetical protein